MTAARIYPSSLAVALIEAYQRFISPHKGFRCAYRARTKRASCSEFAKRVALRRGIVALPALLRERFKRCATAACALAHRRTSEREEERPRHGGSSVTDGCGEAVGEACAHGGAEVAGEAACACAEGLS